MINQGFERACLLHEVVLRTRQSAEPIQKWDWFLRGRDENIKFHSTLKCFALMLILGERTTENLGRRDHFWYRRHFSADLHSNHFYCSK